MPQRFYLALRKEGQDPLLAAFRWVTFDIRTAYRLGTAQLALLDFMDMPTPVIRPFPLTEKMEVRVQFAEGIVTVEIDGSAVFRDLQLPYKTAGYEVVVPGFDRETTEDIPATDIAVRKTPPPATPRPTVPRS